MNFIAIFAYSKLTAMTFLYFISGFCVLFQLVVWTVYFVKTTKKERKELNEQIKAEMKKKYPNGARKVKPPQIFPCFWFPC
jgi:Ca2+/Na+ antiporter